MRRVIGQLAQLETLLFLAEKLDLTETDSEAAELIQAITKMTVVMIKNQQDWEQNQKNSKE